MDKKSAIQLANIKAKKTNEVHYVLYAPEFYREVFDNTGFKVKSEKELKTDKGKIEDLYFVVHKAVPSEVEIFCELCEKKKDSIQEVDTPSGGSIYLCEKCAEKYREVVKKLEMAI
jgi:predicted SprT family Zn-dependent metalloprotease